ncbi:MAG: hypothetical protein ABI807_06620 [Sporichthyaceae bacterium]
MTGPPFSPTSRGPRPGQHAPRRVRVVEVAAQVERSEPDLVQLGPFQPG